MVENKNMLGCFVSTSIGDDKGPLFRKYIWGDNGLCNIIKGLGHEKYGEDLVFILFQFYVNPIPVKLESIKTIESYRRKERSIALSIVINDSNFFDKVECERLIFLKQTILDKIEMLNAVIKKKKLDTDFEKLKADLKVLLF